MATDVGIAMTDDEIEAFLDSHSNGVLSMGIDNTGYGIPMSYGYDPDNDRLFFGFVDAEDSKKRQFREAADAVSFTVYEYEDVDDWASLIVEGTMHVLENTDLPPSVSPVFFKRLTAAPDEPAWVDTDSLDRRVYELRITDLAGRHSGTID